MKDKIFDLIGVGFGPSNIALAIYLEEEQKELDFCFIDAQENVDWQSQMLLSGSDIQNNPLRDLVTPRNPKSHYGFINFLKLHDRLFDYLNLPMHYPLRREYSKYIQWVAQCFDDKVKKGNQVTSLKKLVVNNQPIWQVSCSNGDVILGRSLVMGAGRTTNIPPEIKPILGERVFHLTQYLSHIKKLPETVERIGVLGASQSAVELLLDLLGRFPNKEIYAIHRGFSFRLKDTSPFSDHVYFPEFVDYFYDLPSEGKQNISRQLRATNYSSADGDVIDQLYVKIYEEKLANKHRFKYLNNQKINTANLFNGRVFLDLQEVNTDETTKIELDALILATGFLDLSADLSGEKYPKLLQSIQNNLLLDKQGVIQVSRDYKVLTDETLPPVFLNGLCESSHGLGDAGSFSLVSLRAKVVGDAVLRSLTHHKTHKNPLENKEPAFSPAN